MLVSGNIDYLSWDMTGINVQNVVFDDFPEDEMITDLLRIRIESGHILNVHPLVYVFRLYL